MENLSNLDIIAHNSIFYLCQSLVTRNDNSGNGGVIQMLRRVPPTSSQDVVYHRLDLMMPAGVGVGGRSAGSGGLGSQDLCRYFRSASTLAAASLYLSPAAHLSSFQFESWAEPSSSVIQSFMVRSLMYHLSQREKTLTFFFNLDIPWRSN